MGKNLGAGVAGIVIAFVVIMAIEMLGHAIYPVPEGLDYTDKAAMAEYMAGVPVGGLLFVVAAWALGTFAGTYAACRIGTAPDYLFAMLIGALVLVGITMNVMAFPHPGWMVALGIAATIGAAWLGKVTGGSAASAE